MDLLVSLAVRVGGYQRLKVCHQLLNIIFRHHVTSPLKTIPRIEVPHTMTKNMEKVRVRTAVDKARQNITSRRTSPLLISCKRSEFNHHKGQTYSHFNPKYLASSAWKHKKSPGDYFTILPHTGNPALGSDNKTFGDLGLGEKITECLRNLGISEPTNIQELAIPKVLRGHCILAAAETGSGKTLAYLGPLLELIQRKKSITRGDNSRLNSPHAAILAPSRELADQIMSVAEKFHGPCSVEIESFCGGKGTQRTLPFSMEKEMDLLVSTPGVLIKLLNRGVIKSNRLGHLVLDEMDTLLDDSFSGDIINILKTMKVSAGEVTGDDTYVNTSTQVILVGATLPRGLKDILNGVLPTEMFEKISTSQVHHLMPHVSQKFHRIKPSSKPEFILRLGKESQTKKIPTMIFCNKTATASWLSRFLESDGVDNIFISGSLPQKSRSGRFEKFQNGEQNILVSTDITSRGLDTLRVQQVINYEFPNAVSDYIHRAGRAGRIGSLNPGHVISLVSHMWEVDLVNQIEVSARRTTPLHNVNANIKRKLIHMAELKSSREF